MCRKPPIKSPYKIIAIELLDFYSDYLFIVCISLEVPVLTIGRAVQTGIVDWYPDRITFHSYGQKVVGSTTLPEPAAHPACFVIADFAGFAAGWTQTDWC
nr:MAG TPA: hypothetical protein [Caudoviricetes sp.]